MSALKLTVENFDETINSGRVLVDFWADWCMPCKMLAPIIEELAAELAGEVVVAKLDTEQVFEIAERYGVMSIPTVILFKDGLEMTRLVGVQPKEAYLNALTAAL